MSVSERINGVPSLLIAASFLLMLGISSCSKAQPQEGSYPDTVRYSLRQGKRLFMHYCSPCHGEDAGGEGRYFPSQIGSRPTDFVDSGYLRETATDVIFEAIKFGSASVGKSNYSPAYKNTLRDEEVENIIEYLRSLIKDQ